MFIFGNLFLAVGKLLSLVTTIVTWMIIIRAVLSWFSVSSNNQAVRFLYAVTEPILEPIRALLRRVMPDIGVDLSPIVAIFGLLMIEWFLAASLIDLGRHLM